MNQTLGMNEATEKKKIKFYMGESFRIYFTFFFFFFILYVFVKNFHLPLKKMRSQLKFDEISGFLLNF